VLGALKTGCYASDTLLTWYLGAIPSSRCRPWDSCSCDVMLLSIEPLKLRVPSWPRRSCVLTRRSCNASFSVVRQYTPCCIRCDVPCTNLTVLRFTAQSRGTQARSIRRVDQSSVWSKLEDDGFSNWTVGCRRLCISIDWDGSAHLIY